MLDEMEARELVCIKRYDEMEQPDGRLKCSCGRLFDPLTEGNTLSPDPYAMPVCDACIDEYMVDAKDKK